MASTACTSADSVGIQARLSPSSICPVITARTFGWASAADVSIETMRAWAYGLPRIAPWSMPGHRDVVEVVAPAAEEAGVLLAQHPPEPDRVAGLGERDVSVGAHDDTSCAACSAAQRTDLMMLW